MLAFEMSWVWSVYMELSEVFIFLYTLFTQIVTKISKAGITATERLSEQEERDLNHLAYIIL